MSCQNYTKHPGHLCHQELGSTTSACPSFARIPPKCLNTSCNPTTSAHLKPDPEPNPNGRKPAGTGRNVGKSAPIPSRPVRVKGKPQHQSLAVQPMCLVTVQTVTLMPSGVVARHFLYYPTALLMYPQLCTPYPRPGVWPTSAHQLIPFIYRHALSHQNSEEYVCWG